MLFPILAHGALGSWDELIFLGVAVIFMVMMGVSWVRSRNMEPEFDDPPESSPDALEPADNERFQLD
jgi:hypothetical protein